MFSSMSAHGPRAVVGECRGNACASTEIVKATSAVRRVQYGADGASRRSPAWHANQAAPSWLGEIDGHRRHFVGGVTTSPSFSPGWDRPRRPRRSRREILFSASGIETKVIFSPSSEQGRHVFGQGIGLDIPGVAGAAAPKWCAGPCAERWPSKRAPAAAPGQADAVDGDGPRKPMKSFNPRGEGEQPAAASGRMCSTAIPSTCPADDVTARGVADFQRQVPN